MAKNENLIVGLDIGTTKTCAIVGEVTEEGINIVGIGSSPSRGMRRGVVVNIDLTVESVKKAIEEAELMAGCEITSVYTGIAGHHIKGLNSRGIVAIKEHEVKPTDVKRVIDAAQAVAIPSDREVLHVIPQEFIVDDQDGVKDPIGMAGVRLEAKVHIVTAAATSAQNIIRCCNKAGLNVNEIYLEPLACSESVLGHDEKELGVALVDIGGGTTDVAIFVNGSVVHTSILPLGGNHLTNDVAVGLRTPAESAERIKQKYGCVMTSLVQKDETIEVPSVGGRPPKIYPRQILSEILEPRIEEIFHLVQQEIARSGFEDRIAAGMVLTGGCSILEGMPELAEQVFNLPVRRGVPKGVGGLADVVKSPMYATAVGLMQAGSHAGLEAKMNAAPEQKGVGKITTRMKEWFNEIF